MPRLASSHNKQMIRIKEAYLDAGGSYPVTSKELARFAINNGFWKFHRDKLLNICAKEMSRALREEYFIDPWGRTVRIMHAARRRRSDSEEQMMLWADIRTAEREHMEVALQQRRMQIAGDCRQLNTDKESYNDMHPEQHPIQLVFDFRDDVAEGKQPKEFRPQKAR